MARILIIDDNEQIREMIGEYLKTEGFEVETAADGAQGLAAFRRRPAALIITDLVMPEKEGLEVITEIKQLNPSTKIIAVSGGGYNQNLAYLTIAERLGADRAISKPVKIEALMALIRELLGQ